MYRLHSHVIILHYKRLLSYFKTIFLNFKVLYHTFKKNLSLFPEMAYRKFKKIFFFNLGESPLDKNHSRFS